ncbi:MAG: hypothetical protein ACOC0V_03705 [Oceanicaulis sp.]
MKIHPGHLAYHIVQAARRRRTLTYAELGEAVGLIARGLGLHLAALETWCAENGLPPLTLLVVKRDTGRPSDEGRYQGRRYGEMSPDEIDRLQREVFDHDWDRYGKVFAAREPE